VTIYDENSNKSTSPKKSKLNKTLSSDNFDDSINEITLLENQNVEYPDLNYEKNTQDTIENGEYIPQFNDLQRKQLDEQLRNVFFFCFKI
jgi:hypothetical protein